MITTQTIEYTTTDNTPVDIPINISASAARINGIVYVTNGSDVSASYRFTSMLGTHSGNLGFEYWETVIEYEMNEVLDVSYSISNNLFTIIITGIDSTTMYWNIELKIHTTG